MFFFTFDLRTDKNGHFSKGVYFFTFDLITDKNGHFSRGDILFHFRFNNRQERTFF